MQEDKAYILIQ